MSLEEGKGMEILRKCWDEISKLPKEKLREISFIDDLEMKTRIRKILRGRTKSYKYALLTQVLAKRVSPSINALVLQRQAAVRGAFDARSFCRKVIVEFEKKYLNGIIGGSEDPYVSKPLRHTMITLNGEVLKHIKDKDGWRRLYTILNTIQVRNDENFTENVLRQILLEIRIIQEEVEEAAVRSLIPPYIPAYKLKHVIDIFLETPSEGARAQSIVYALIRVLNKKVNAFKRIESSRSTTADVYARRLADIECFGEDDSVKVGIAVTENLDYLKLREELDKAVRRGLNKLVIVAYKVTPDKKFSEVLRMYERNVDIVITRLTDLILMLTTLLNNEMRKDFIKEVGQVLRELEYAEHFKAWQEILEQEFSRF